MHVNYEHDPLRFKAKGEDLFHCENLILNESKM
jgi:hypothetical protein